MEIIMSWYNTEGKCPHNAIFSKTRYLRNISGLPFPRRAGEKLLEPYFAKIDSLLSKNGFRKEAIPGGDSPQLFSLAEKGFVDAEFLASESTRAIYFNEPCSLAVAVGGKDLITICSLLSGRALTETRNIASGAEELLDGEFEFAYSDNTGYISHAPALCGSGAEFSVMLYLPALSQSGQIEKTERFCHRLSATLTPAFTYPDGDLYTLSYSPSHNQDESAAAEGFDGFVGKLIEEERALERMIFAEKSKIIIEKAWRAYGILLYARHIDEKELLSLSSDIRFALSATDSQAKLPPVGIKDLNFMLAECLNASVIAKKGSSITEEDCRHARAEIVSGFLYSDATKTDKG